MDDLSEYIIQFPRNLVTEDTRERSRRQADRPVFKAAYSSIKRIAMKMFNGLKAFFSRASFTVDKEGEESVITLDHSGYPDDAVRHLDAGWPNIYWDPLRRYLESD